MRTRTILIAAALALTIAGAGVVAKATVDGWDLHQPHAAMAAINSFDPVPTDGDEAYITDASTCTFMATVTGGGTIHCPIHYDGSSSTWKAG